MKKILLLIFITVIGASVSAQTDTRDRQDTRDQQIDTHDRQGDTDRNYQEQGDSEQVELKDGYIIRDGRMMSVNNGMTSAMKKEATLRNGTVVAVNGNYTVKDGKPTMLKDGEHMDMDGNITKQPAQRDTKRN